MRRIHAGAKQMHTVLRDGNCAGYFVNTCRKIKGTICAYCIYSILYIACIVVDSVTNSAIIFDTYNVAGGGGKALT